MHENRPRKDRFTIETKVVETKTRKQPEVGWFIERRSVSGRGAGASGTWYMATWQVEVGARESGSLPLILFKLCVCMYST